jgi:hypothetical protein
VGNKETEIRVLLDGHDGRGGEGIKKKEKKNK